MNLNYITDSLYLIKPELAISSLLVLLVLVDLIWMKNKKALPWIASAGLIIAGYFVTEQFGMNTFAFSARKPGRYDSSRCIWSFL